MRLACVEEAEDEIKNARTNVVDLCCLCTRLAQSAREHCPKEAAASTKHRPVSVENETLNINSYICEE